MYSFIKLCKQDTVKIFENTQSYNDTPNKGEMLLNKNKTRTDYVYLFYFKLSKKNYEKSL